LAAAFATSAPAMRAHVLGSLRSPPWPAVERLIAGDRDQLRSVLQRTDIRIPAHVVAASILAGQHRGFVERLTEQLVGAASGHDLLLELRIAIDAEPDPARLRTLADHARRYAQALELADGDAVLAELAAMHPVEQLLGLEHAIRQWLADVEAPPALIPLLPELHAHCTRRLAKLAKGPQPRLDLPALQERNDAGYRRPVPWDERGRLRDLISAIERLR
ncbi:MAG: hypothetical protein M3680_15990, partial [Myxococcota bacterium]|nr:hypothetical protein [Myxococcota bacterium]